MSKIVLDASAILAYLFEETGCESVEELLESGHGVISSVNYAEVTAKLVVKKMPDVDIKSVMDNLELECIPLSEKQAFLSGQLHRNVQKLGLSLGDRACLALGVDQSLPVLTADKIWKQVPIECEIRLLR